MKLKKFLILLPIFLIAIFAACGNKEKTLSDTENIVATKIYVENNKDDKKNDAISNSDIGFNSLEIEPYTYPQKFTLDSNLESAIVEMALSIGAFDSSVTKEEYYPEFFIDNYCQNSRMGFEYLEKIAEENDGMLSKEQIEYMQYSLTGEFVDFQNFVPIEGIDRHQNTHGLGFGRIISYDAEVCGDEVKLIAEFKRVRDYSEITKLYELCIILIKNPESCFDGYSIKSLTSKDITPIIYGDNKEHTFEGCYLADEDGEDDAIFTFENPNGKDDIIYDLYITVDLSDNPKLADFVRQNPWENFDVTYFLDESMTQPVYEVVPTDIKLHEENSEMEPDPYVGEYNCYDIHEPYLEIQKNEDNTYEIQIDIFRLLLLDDCVGHATAEGIAFSTTKYTDTEMTGLITLEGKDEDGFTIAKVTFTSENFNNYSSINEYEYYKVSDIPDMYKYDHYDGDDEDEDVYTYIEVDLEGLVYPYDYLEAHDPRVQQLIDNGWKSGFDSTIFINGLIGYYPVSSNQGKLRSYYKDEEFFIDKNVGKGLFQSEQLAVVQDNIRKMLMEIIRAKGENAMEYQEYFSDQAMLENIQTFMVNEIEEDWQILDGFYLTAYSGNTNVLHWGEEDRKRLTETDSHYNMGFSFYADYRAMGCNEDEEEAAVLIDCSISKETGLIDELVIEKAYMEKSFFETSRF